MNTLIDVDSAIGEHRFWLQILGDHSRFIFYSLAPTESEYILTAQNFIILFDNLLKQAQKLTTETELEELNRKIYEAVYRLREYKIRLLSLSITSDLKIHLPPTFFNDMLNELEEYLNILNSLMYGYTPMHHPLHYHLLWLNDAIGHAASVMSLLDPIEKDLIKQADHFENQFDDLNLKAVTMNGYLRSGIRDFAALDQLNKQAWTTMNSFIELLENLRDGRMDHKVLGTLMPLMTDHMLREECYYLQKLSQSTDTVRPPDCTSLSPRLEV